jgi:hypothetical protein
VRSVKYLLILAAVAACAPAADMTACVCDFSKPGGAAKIECALSMIARNQPTWEAAFLLKDNSPAKPHQWLALPKGEYGGGSPLSLMKDSERLALWSVAAQKAKDLFGDDWALAMNGADRSQCHLHIHIGKMKPGSEKGGGIVVDDLSQIPAPSNGNGVWVHPEGGKLHVHTDEVGTEYVLEE